MNQQQGREMRRDEGDGFIQGGHGTSSNMEKPEEKRRRSVLSRWWQEDMKKPASFAVSNLQLERKMV